MKYPILETSRLLLRPLEEADLDNMFKLQTDIMVRKMLEGNIPCNIDKYSKEFYNTVNNGNMFAIILKDSSAFVGYIILHQHIKKNKLAFSQIAMSIYPEYWNSGFATEAVMKILHFAFYGVKTPWLCANQFQFNPAAGKVLQKCGLKYYTTYKMQNMPYDQYRYIKEDYFNNNPQAFNNSYSYEFELEQTPFYIEHSPYSYNNPIRTIENITYQKQSTEYLCRCFS